MQIGRFRHVGDAFVGRLQTHALKVPLQFVPTQFDNAKAPEWRINLDCNGDCPEIGSWRTHGRGAGATNIAMRLDCPMFSPPLPTKLVAARGEQDMHLFLLWSRPACSRRGD